jgi:hypothetical protein
LKSPLFFVDVPPGEDLLEEGGNSFPTLARYLGPIKKEIKNLLNWCPALKSPLFVVDVPPGEDLLEEGGNSFPTLARYLGLPDR